MLQGVGGGATRSPRCPAIRFRQSMGEADWMSARLPGQEEGWHSACHFVNVAWYATVLPGSCCWTFQTTRGEQLNLCATRQTSAPARFPFSSASKLICINLQATGNPSLMIPFHYMHPFFVGEEKVSASSLLFWNLWHAIGTTFHNLPLISQMHASIHIIDPRGSKCIETKGLELKIKNRALNGDQSRYRMFSRFSSHPNIQMNYKTLLQFALLHFGKQLAH